MAGLGRGAVSFSSNFRYPLPNACVPLRVGLCGMNLQGSVLTHAQISRTRAGLIGIRVEPVRVRLTQRLGCVPFTQLNVAVIFLFTD